MVRLVISLEERSRLYVECAPIDPGQLKLFSDRLDTGSAGGGNLIAPERLVGMWGIIEVGHVASIPDNCPQMFSRLKGSAHGAFWY